jgi:hypothetical protein
MVYIKNFRRKTKKVPGKATSKSFPRKTGKVPGKSTLKKFPRSTKTTPGKSTLKSFPRSTKATPGKTHKRYRQGTGDELSGFYSPEISSQNAKYISRFT